MDTTDKEITFDENGYCNHCNDYFLLAKHHVYNGKKHDEELRNIVSEIKEDGKNKEYDCVIGLSGGVDSSYAAYITKQLGLRALAVHFDNGWNSEQAVKNIENIVSKLGFDYQTYVVDWNEFKDLQVAFLKASVANAEIPSDQAFLAALYAICERYKIKYVISGTNVATEGILPKSWGYNAKDLTHLLGIHKKFGKAKLKTYPKLGFLKEVYYTYVRGIKLVRLLNYVPYKKMAAMEVLRKELNWEYYGGKHYESVFTRFFQAYILPKKFGIDKRKAHLSALICAGEISREGALEEMKKELYPPQKLKDDIEYVTKKLGLSQKEFDEILNAPPRSYKDYPNDESKLKLIYSVYNFLKK